jgi:hypothetical protein
VSACDGIGARVDPTPSHEARRFCVQATCMG